MGPLATPLDSQNQQSPFHGVPPTTCFVPSNDLCTDHILMQVSKNLQTNFIPSRLPWLLAHASPIREPHGRSGFALHTVASFHRPELHHYYGIICHLTPLRVLLDSSLISPIRAVIIGCRNGIRLPRLRRTPCE